jgi:hypothetical protein
MESEALMRSVVQNFVLANQINQIKSQIINYQDNLKSNYSSNIAILNKKIIALELEKQDRLDRCNQLQ